MNEEKKKVSLSNDGLSNFIIKDPVFTLKPVVIDGKVVLKKEAEVTTNPPMLIKDGNFDEVRNYLKYLLTVASKRKIVDTDKVFFTKNSNYPRTSFNRYSEKARRVESLKIADKIVLADSLQICSTQRGYLHFSIGTPEIFKIRPHDKDIVDSILNTNLVTNTFGATITQELQALRNSTWGYNGPSLTTILGKMLAIQDNISNSKIERYEILGGYNIPDTDTFTLLCEGHPISKFITDASVNSYIDSLKTDITKDNYSILVNSLTSKNNITMGLKLLENMNISKNLGYFYALMVVAITKNQSELRNNSSFTGIGMKNIIKTYNIDELLDMTNRYNYGRFAGGLDVINHAYNELLSTEQDKVIFLTETETLTRECLEDALGKWTKDYISLKIKNNG